MMAGDLSQAAIRITFCHSGLLVPYIWVSGIFLCFQKGHENFTLP